MATTLRRQGDGLVLATTWAACLAELPEAPSTQKASGSERLCAGRDVFESSVERHENRHVAGLNLGQDSAVVQLASMILLQKRCALFDCPDLGIVRDTFCEAVPDEIHVLPEFRIIRYAFSLSRHRAHDEGPAEEEQPKGGGALFAERISRYRRLLRTGERPETLLVRTCAGTAHSGRDRFTTGGGEPRDARRS